MRRTLLPLALLMLSSGCASDRPAVSSLPVLPPRVPPIVKAPPGPSFQDRMQNFLQAKLPEPTPSAPTSPPATGSTTR